MRRFRPRRALAALGASALVALPALPAGAVEYGPNRIANPGGEDGACGEGLGGVPVPGWSVTGDTAVICWTTGQGYPEPTDPGPPDRAAAFFGGGYGALSTLSQDIDVTADAATIDGGTAEYEIAGWLGGYLTQEDGARLTVNFFDEGGQVLGFVALGPVTAAERGGATALLERRAVGTVPPTTRRVTVELLFSRAGGSSNDGYADSISYRQSVAGPDPVIPEVPWAALLPIAAVAAGGALLVIRRRVA